MHVPVRIPLALALSVRERVTKLREINTKKIEEVERKLAAAPNAKLIAERARLLEIRKRLITGNVIPMILEFGLAGFDKLEGKKFDEIILTKGVILGRPTPRAA